MSETDFSVLNQSIWISAPASRIWEALTQPEQLRQWFAESADVEPRVGGKYAFYGKWIPWGFDPDRAEKTLSTFEPTRQLAFDWHFHNFPTRFTVSLAESADRTEVRLQHDILDEPQSYRFWVVQDYATIYLHNLKSFVETGRPACLPDFSQDRDTAVCSIEIDAEPPEVFRALTDPEWLAQWVSPKATVELKVGGVYSFGWTLEKDGAKQPVGPHRVLELEPNRRLTHDWTYGDEPPTQARWEIETLSGGRSRLSVTHSGFGPTCDVTDYINGWGGYLCLGKAMLEGRGAPKLKQSVG